MSRQMNKLMMIGVVGIASAVAYFTLSARNSVANAEDKNLALVEVQVPAQFSPEALRGEIAYNQTCSTCHGLNGVGVDGKGPPLVHKIYEPSHHGDGAILMAIARGVQAHHWNFGDMPAQPDVSEVEAFDIIEYLRELQRANGIN